MHFLNQIKARLAALFRKRQLDAEMDEEMRSHVELRTQANLEAGMNPEEARFAALRQFGWTESIKETSREQRGVTWLENLARDIRYGARQLRKNRGFTAVAVLTLALGIGANTSIVTIINALIFKPVNAHRPEELAGLFQHERGKPRNFELFSFPDFSELRSDKTVFSDLAAYNLASIGIREDTLVRATPAAIVSANFFSVLGINPLLGRTFLPEEETAALPVAVLDYAFWQRLGGNPDIVGRTLRAATGEFTIVGVMPKGFTGTDLVAPAFYLPAGMIQTLWLRPGERPSSALTDRSQRMFMLFGRFNDGLNISRAGAGLQLMSERYRIANPKEPKARELIAAPLGRFAFGARPSRFTQEVTPVAVLAFGLATVVLCVACLNLANMLLARGATRRKEIAIRLSLGGSRRRVVRQLLTEGFLLALIGGAGGLLLAMIATRELARFANAGFGFNGFQFDATPDFRILLSLLGLCVFSTLVFALGPARKLTSLDVNNDLKQQGEIPAASAGFGLFNLRNLLVIGQLALSLPLLSAAGLFTRSAFRAIEANPGFSFDSLVIARIDMGLVKYPDARAREILRQAEERLSQLPGVQSVSASRFVPLRRESWMREVQIGGAPASRENAQSFQEGKAAFARFNIITTDYFRTLRIPLVAGREFDRQESESDTGPRTAILSQTLAAKLFSGEDAVGRTVQFPADHPNGQGQILQVVGVVPAVTWDLFETEAVDAIYAPLGQHFDTTMRMHVRTAPNADPQSFLSLIRETLRQIDPQIPITELQTMETFHRENPILRIMNVGAILFGLFGGVALLLSFIGVYALKAYAVARRTREIGIRIALGATRREIIRMILSEGARLIAIGLGAGLFLAVGIGRLARQFLYGVAPADFITLGTVLLSLAAVVMLACWLPARRAARVDPMEALRCE